MITKEAQLQQTVEQIGCMYVALAALQAEVLPQSRQQFALMVDGPVKALRRLQGEMIDYIRETLYRVEPSKYASVPAAKAT